MAIKEGRNPKKLYKFIKSEHLTALREYGRLAIGTADSYRKDDGKVGGRGDILDTARVWKPDSGSTILTSKSKLFNIPEGHQIDLRFTTEAAIRVTAECAMFCTSTRLSDGLVTRMRDTFGCDTYFRVTEPELFTMELCSHPDLAAFRCIGRHVSYADPTPAQRASDDRADAWIKREIYRWQREYRLVWLTPKDFKPRLVDVPGILPYIDFPS